MDNQFNVMEVCDSFMLFERNFMFLIQILAHF